MKNQRARSVTKSSPSYQGKSCFTLRGRKMKDGVIQGKLRLRSMPGVFFVLGFFVVIVGTALAVAGYWPYRISKMSLLGAAESESISESPTSAWSVGPKGFLSTASLMHSERMKLLGPVIMGVGLFILICANTVLYENRDRETQILLAQMHSVICSVSTAVPAVDLKEIIAANAMAKHYQWVSSLPAAHLNIVCLQQLTISDPMLQSRQHTEQQNSIDGIYQQPVFQTQALHHQESKHPPSLHSHLSNSSNASLTDLYTQPVAMHRGSGIFSLEPTLFIKHNNCLVSASSMSTLEVDSEDIPATHPRRCQSMSYRTNPYTAQSPVCFEVGFYTAEEEGEINQPLVTRREAGSQVIINIPGQVVDAAEEQTHSSWPRLDLGTGRRYMKLENKEDSVDKLLDLLEQQCLQWDKSFGSGPFQ